MAAAQEDEYDWNFQINAAVGIDLGTTYSCVSVYKDSRVTIIPDEYGNKLVPSVVLFQSDGDEIKKIVGRDAVEDKSIDDRHVITEVKRLIGRKFNEKAVQTNMRRWPFFVTPNSDGKAQINIYFDGQSPLYLSPEEISSSILFKLKQMAEKHLGKGKVNEAVITVPAHFNNSQRKATMKAAELTNLRVLAIINEPNAAALAYGIRSKVKERRRILVMDIGGGTSDVALIEVVDENFTVLACKGDNNVGGEDFDTNLVQYCVEQIKEKMGSDVTIGTLQMRRLRNKCEQAKRKLSENPADPDWHYVLELDDFIDDTNDITILISRTKFEEVNQHLFDRAIGLVSSCLLEAKLSLSDINDLVPVGGSMRIPKLREMLQNQFQGKQLFAYINPDEAVAVGASIIAAQKIGLYRGHIVLSDITPFSLGIRVDYTVGIKKDAMSVIIPKSTKIPCKNQQRYWTTVDNQTIISIAVYQGENEFVKDNMFLGNFVISDLTPALAGVTKVDVTMEVNTNGILKVTAREVETVDDNVVTGELDTLLPHLNMLNVTELE